MSESSTYARGKVPSFVGGALCLDFANTAGSHLLHNPRDYIVEYADLVAWARAAGLLDRAGAVNLLAAAARRPAAAEATLCDALGLRLALYRLFAPGECPPGACPPREVDLTTLNAALARALARARLVPAGDGLAWGWDDAPAALDRVLWPVARSAAELLTAPERVRVHACAGDTCGWLFLDQSRNRSRRWCDMADCGNRAKSRRHYQRARAAGSA